MFNLILVNEIKFTLDVDMEGYFSKYEFLKAAENSYSFINLVEESIKNVRKVDKMIEHDLEEHFQTWIPMTNNM